ncbi:Cthe_2314 family HEPN domain-containing protein [Spirosoma pulveris]
MGESISDYFKFPTRNERVIARKDYPEIQPFNFGTQSQINDLLSSLTSDGEPQDIPLKEISRREHLFQWNLVLMQRFDKLRGTYIRMITSHNRLITNGLTNNSVTERNANIYLFEYYAELFHYFFISSRDIVAQILNTYYEIGVKEYDVKFNENLFKKIFKKDSSVSNALQVFDQSISTLLKRRNQFTHRFTPTRVDYRPKYEEINGMKVMSLGLGLDSTTPSAEALVKDVNESLQILKTLMDSCKLVLKF